MKKEKDTTREEGKMKWRCPKCHPGTPTEHGNMCHHPFGTDCYHAHDENGRIISWENWFARERAKIVNEHFRVLTDFYFRLRGEGDKASETFWKVNRSFNRTVEELNSLQEKYVAFQIKKCEWH